VAAGNSLGPGRVRRAVPHLLQSRAAPIGAGRNALILAEKPIEIAGITKSQAVGNLFDGKIELLQARARLLDQSRVNDGARADALLPLAMRMELVLGEPSAVA
jgi:hypothetical protein